MANNYKFLYFGNCIILHAQDYVSGCTKEMENYFTGLGYYLDIVCWLIDNNINYRFDVMESRWDGLNAWKDAVFYHVLILEDANDLLKFKLAFG